LQIIYENFTFVKMSKKLKLTVNQVDAIEISRRLLELPEINTSKVSHYVYDGYSGRAKLNQKKKGENKIFIHEAEKIIAYYNNLNNKICNILQGKDINYEDEKFINNNS
tara:strand:- start:1027 stop:1353 length:327 start_codon:yes stop_codon:yes gene_type:complete